METWQVILTITGSILGSGGLWSFLTIFVQKHLERKSASNQLLLGISHNIIMDRCNEIIDRYETSKIGITDEEYTNLMKYMYKPYIANGGNDTALHRKIEYIEKNIKPLILHPEETGAIKRCSTCRHSDRDMEENKLYCYESKKKMVGDGDRCGKWETESYGKESA